MEIADTAGEASALRETDSVVIIVNDSRSARCIRPLVPLNSSTSHRTNRKPERKSGQVAQVVERSPEKAGVGGSTPSLATILFNDLIHPLGISPVIFTLVIVAVARRRTSKSIFVNRALV